MITSKYDFNNVKYMPPPTSYGTNTQSRQGNRPIGTSMSKQGGEFRPVTSNRAANYGKDQDNMNLTSQYQFKDLDKKQENSVELNLKNIERKINKLVEDCANHNLKKEFRESLEKAKEAVSLEKTLRKQREQANVIDTINTDLTFSVMFNLAVQYQYNQMPTVKIFLFLILVSFATIHRNY